MLKSNQSNNCCSMLTVCLAEEPKDQDYDYEQPIGILKLYNRSKYILFDIIFKGHNLLLTTH